MTEPKGQQVPPQTRVTGCLVRFCWMLLGNAVLLGCAVFIAQNKGTSFSRADIAFWCIVAALVVLRYVDVRKLSGQTATGEPATMAHWSRYAERLIEVSLLVWLLAHGAASL